MNYTWVLYDASCPFCTAGAYAFKNTLEKQNCKIKPLQNQTVMKILDVKEGQDFPEMKVIGDDSKLYGGANAIIYVCKKIWWASPLWALAHMPFARTIFDYIYKLIAKRRHCHAICEV